MRWSALSVAVVLGACAASHSVPEPDGGPDPRRPCETRDDCSYDCCTDPDTGYRYCCSHDYTYRRADGATVYLCGEGPPCIHGDVCCSGPAVARGSEQICVNDAACSGIADSPYSMCDDLRRDPGPEPAPGPRAPCASSEDCLFECCMDPFTSERYCCDFDHVLVREDGLEIPMCGDGPACTDDTVCCAETAARFPGGVRRCTHNLVLCEWLSGAYCFE